MKVAITLLLILCISCNNNLDQNNEQTIKKVSVLATIDSNTQKIKKEIDKFTGDTTYTTNLFSTRDVSFSGVLDGNREIGKYLSIVFICHQPICVDKNANVYFLFTDGTRSENLSSNKYNCDGSFIVSTWIYHNTVFSFLKTKLVKSIRLMGVNKTIDFDITSDQASQLKNDFVELYSILSKGKK
jgi:hypothetical protein